MKKGTSNNIFIKNFIKEGYKSVDEKVNEIKDKIKKLESEEEQALKNWGGASENEEEFSAEEFFGDAGDAAEEDIKSDPEMGGEDEFASFGSLEDPRMLKSLTESEFRLVVRNIIKESGYPPLDGGENADGGESENDNNDDATVAESDDNLEEERIANTESKKEVSQLKNFIGSHIYGEDLGDLGKMYVAYSYGEQFPTYLHYKGKWYHNTDYYMLDDGKINKPTEKHKKDMKPSKETHGMSTIGLQSLIRAFKKKNKLGDNNHTDVEPGEKN
jgi:hypothetical protein